jgi:aminoglycoside phosphotransferase (APT) family kinase protein
VTLPIPESPDDLTPQWLTAALAEAGIDARVSSVSIDSDSLSSVTSHVARLAVTYEAGSAGVAPRSLIWKRSAQEPARRRDFAEGYEREVEFYREIAPHISTRVPRCFCAVCGPGGAHVILLEDLDGFAGAGPGRGPTADQAKAFAREIAGLHALRCGVGQPDSPDHLARYGEPYAALFDSSMELLGQFVDHDAQLAVARYGEHVVEWHERLMAMPQTLVHGDAHAGNVLFSAEAGEVAIVDWQGWRTGPGISDVARFVTLSLAPDLRRAAEEGIVAAYVEALAALGAEYPFARAMVDYRVASGWQWGWAVVFSRHASSWTGETRDLMHILVPRAVEALRDAARAGLLD